MNRISAIKKDETRSDGALCLLRKSRTGICGSPPIAKSKKTTGLAASLLLLSSMLCFMVLKWCEATSGKIDRYLIFGWCESWAKTNWCQDRRHCDEAQPIEKSCHHPANKEGSAQAPLEFRPCFRLSACKEAVPASCSGCQR